MATRILVAGFLCITLLVSSRGSKEETPEAIFRRTVSSWHSVSTRNDWGPWSVFCDELWQRFNIPQASDRLDVVGALEESILIIERAIFQEDQDANPARDVALSKLYTMYAKSLMNLDGKECLALALDPHTLLIGAEMVNKSNPDNHICVENAENSLRNAVSLDATNNEANQLISYITGKADTVHKRKPTEFVAELFDSFADTFDDKLLNTLDYKVPGLVGELAKRLSPTYDAVLDAGCGTGLAGRNIRPLVPSGIILGVDASQKMLDKARACTLASGCGLAVAENQHLASSPLYDQLVRMDLEEMSIETLSEATGLELHTGFDLIVAADVLVYFGSLDVLLHTFAKLSTNGGRLVFSCELATEDEAPLGWRLLPTGRFAHTKKHAIQNAKSENYELVFYEEITPRMEKGHPVRGHLFAFEMKKREENVEL